MATETNWLPGILVFAAGVVGSITFLFISKRGGARVDGSADDLDARYQTVIGELKEHVANKHLLPADAWEREKQRLEQRAVELLRARDGARHDNLKAQGRAEQKARAAAADEGFFAKFPVLKGVLIGGATVTFVGLSWTSLKEATAPRKDGMEATGTVPGTEPARDDRLEPLLETIKKNPDDIDALSEAALFLISKQAFSEANAFVQRATMLDPFHLKTRVCRAVLRAVDGDVPGSLSELERLGALYPEAYPGHLYAGMLALDQNDQARAVMNFERYLAVAPPSETPPMLRGAIGQLKQQLPGKAPTP